MCVSHVRAECKHVARDSVPRIRTGLQRFDGKAMPQIMQSRPRADSGTVNVCGFANVLKGLRDNRVAKAATASTRYKHMVSTSERLTVTEVLLQSDGYAFVYPHETCLMTMPPAA
jgi:hypothetical protein